MTNTESGIMIALRNSLDAAEHNQDEVFTQIADRPKDYEGDYVKSAVAAD